MIRIFVTIRILRAYIYIYCNIYKLEKKCAFAQGGIHIIKGCKQMMNVYRLFIYVYIFI